MAPNIRRLTKEIADIHADTVSNISIMMVPDKRTNVESLTNLLGSFRGPPGTPYEGGTYEIAIQIPEDYPFKPPKMSFNTKVWHPNISSQTVSASAYGWGLVDKLIAYFRAQSASIPSPPPGHLSSPSSPPFSPFNHCSAPPNPRIRKMPRSPAC